MDDPGGTTEWWYISAAHHLQETSEAGANKGVANARYRGGDYRSAWWIGAGEAAYVGSRQCTGASYGASYVLWAAN